MSCGIYKITNNINGHSYIGQSINIEKRWRHEKSYAFNSNSESYSTLLSRAFRKYGLENFTFEILEECSQSELNFKEKYYIQKYDTYNSGYNMTTGGDGAPNTISKISKEDLQKIIDLLRFSTISQKEIALQFNVGQDVISTINHGKSRRIDSLEYPLRNNKKYICCDCGKTISFGALRCANCEKIRQRIVDRPSRENLKNLIRNLPFTKIAQQYGVSDKTISKWCIYYNLPSKKSLIKQIKDEDWINI